jgi:hypothetical protein
VYSFIDAGARPNLAVTASDQPAAESRLNVRMVAMASAAPERGDPRPVD